MNRSEILLLFDVDGTLTKARQPIDADFERFLMDEIRPKFTIGVVGGSDLGKIAEQMNGNRFVEKFDYVFAENGLVYFKNGKEQKRTTICDFVDARELDKLEKYALQYIEDLQLPFKREVFVERRTGLVNISPVGRTCSAAERDAFEQYDRQHAVRANMIAALKKAFGHLPLHYVVGGQISFDVFAIGCDKTFCLRHVQEDAAARFREIHFFGDKTHPGGNDYEIFHDKRVRGHKVDSPRDTRDLLLGLLQRVQ